MACHTTSNFLLTEIPLVVSTWQYEKLNQKESNPAVKKDAVVKKKMCHPKWQPRNGCDVRLLAKEINNDNSGTEFYWNMEKATQIRLDCCYSNFHHKLTMTAVSWAPLWISFLFFLQWHPCTFYLQLGCFGLEIVCCIIFIVAGAILLWQ